jgi:uncharacterized C2H2 Zn-finger protein
VSPQNSKYGEEFKEIGHCGAKYTVSVQVINEERVGISFGIHHSTPLPASIFGVWALPQGIPVGDFPLGGVTANQRGDSFTGMFQVLIASDKQGLFGHSCPRCGEYWRSRAVPSEWGITCPYCGLRTNTYAFLTEGQRRYVKACCALVEEAIQEGKEKTYVIDMDKVADETGQEGQKPDFYYAEESQQNFFTCKRCGAVNDILGRYGYCSCCGTFNALQELELEAEGIRTSIEDNNVMTP